MQLKLGLITFRHTYQNYKIANLLKFSESILICFMDKLIYPALRNKELCELITSIFIVELRFGDSSEQIAFEKLE